MHILYIFIKWPITHVNPNHVVESDSTDDDYEADEEDTQEVGYASEPSANILRVSFQCFIAVCVK